MARYIEIGEPVDIDPLTEEDLNAIKYLMPKFYVNIMNLNIDWTDLYLVRDGMSLKVISKDILDKDYRAL